MRSLGSDIAPSAVLEGREDVRTALADNRTLQCRASRSGPDELSGMAVELGALDQDSNAAVSVLDLVIPITQAGIESSC